MLRQFRPLVLALLLLVGPRPLAAQEADPVGDAFPDRVLHYGAPAGGWLEALPVGNGRLGAMVFGGVSTERIQLNEESVWAGRRNPGFERGAPRDLAEMRRLLAEGRHAEVEATIMKRFSGGMIRRSHQTAGDLHLEFPAAEGEVRDYVRRLS